jgi:hypothetical protein
MSAERTCASAAWPATRNGNALAMPGIHWRSDAVAGLRLGEAVALSILGDMKECFNERFRGFSLTTFDGREITV